MNANKWDPVTQVVVVPMRGNFGACTKSKFYSPECALCVGSGYQLLKPGIPRQFLVVSSCCATTKRYSGPTCRLIVIPKCFRYYETSYYMYANADMLFDEGLIKTLEYLKFFPQRLDKMMMVGVRTNINASLITNVYK